MRVARDLFIVGWIKCRASFAAGHVRIPLLMLLLQVVMVGLLL